MICSDETEDSLVSLFKMISENDMRTFMEEQGKSILNRIITHIILVFLKRLLQCVSEKSIEK